MDTESSAKDDPAAKLRERIVKRAAQELKHGMNVNLGIGIPTLCSNVGTHVMDCKAIVVVVSRFCHLTCMQCVCSYFLVSPTWCTNHVTK